MGLAYSMRRNDFKAGVLIVGLTGLAGVLPLSAQLPTLSERDQLGYFIFARNKSFQFGVASDGKTTIKVTDGRGASTIKLTIDVDFQVTETMPDGKKINRKINPKSLESAQAATDKPKNVVIKGKVTGDIEFEASVSEERGTIILGGHLLDATTLKNSTQFSIAVKIPNSLTGTKTAATKKEVKALKDKLKGDKMQLIWTDGKKVKIPANKAIEGASKDVSGPGSKVAVIEISAFKDRKIQLTASPNSAMMVSNPSTQTLAEGFSLNWTADTAKDPEGKARLAIEVR